MDMRRIKNEDKLDLCKKYYYGGFALLPFLWLINTVWFFRLAFFSENFEQQSQIRTYVIRSMVGTILWTGIIITWVTIFQMNRAAWGELGDQLSFVIPKGIP